MEKSQQAKPASAGSARLPRVSVEPPESTKKAGGFPREAEHSKPRQHLHPRCGPCSPCVPFFHEPQKNLTPKANRPNIDGYDFPSTGSLPQSTSSSKSKNTSALHGPEHLPVI